MVGAGGKDLGYATHSPSAVRVGRVRPLPGSPAKGHGPHRGPGKPGSGTGRADANREAERAGKRGRSADATDFRRPYPDHSCASSSGIVGTKGRTRQEGSNPVYRCRKIKVVAGRYFRREAAAASLAVAAAPSSMLRYSP